MLYLIILFVCFLASVGGAICGIGGGVIIKPILDTLGVMEVSSINFLSGCTVLAMSTYSLIKSKVNGSIVVERRTGMPLALGAVFGGIVGKWMFQFILSHCADKDLVRAIQAICLLVVTIGTLLYTLFKKYIKTLKITNPIFIIIIGCLLGLMSSFLGIGGGPINLIVLFYFFSMGTKEAAENSLYIIFFSQLASLGQAVVTNTIPNFQIMILLFMITGGIIGGIVGRSINNRIDDRRVDQLFIMLMLFMIGININNIIKFSL